MFSVNNKVVVEFLEENRSQVILEDAQDEISSVVFSPDSALIAASVGCVNRDKGAPILLYETENWTLVKRLNFHFKGIQLIRFSTCGGYLISVGNYDEKSICIWNLSNYTVVESKSLKFQIFDIKPERLLMIGENLNTNGTPSCTNLKKGLALHFVTAALEVLSFWRLESGSKLESYHLKIEDLLRDKGEYLTAIEMTPYFERVKTSFILLGTSNGNCLVIDKEKKLLIKKYCVSQTMVNSIKFKLDRLIVTTESPIIYSWKIPYAKIDEESVFDFVKSTKENCSLLFLDKEIRCSDFTIDGKEGLVATENGGIFYVNLSNLTNIKIINSHLNDEINSVNTYDTDQLISSSDDGTIRAWTLDSYDQKYEFCYFSRNQTCDQVEYNKDEGIAVVLFKVINPESDTKEQVTNYNERSMIQNSFNKTQINPFNYSNIQTYLRIYNMNKLKSIGKVSIPDQGIFINNFKLIFNGRGIIATTYQDKVYVIDVQNWDPVSLLYSETIGDYIPKNQQFKHIACLNIDNSCSVCSMSFSNGSIILLKIFKNQGFVESAIMDKFNIFEYHMSKSDDINTAELFKNLTKFKTNYLCSSLFSNIYENYLYCFHESLQFLFIRNFSTKDMFRRIALNYFPLSLNMTTNEDYMAIGTKEGMLLFVTRLENSVNSGFNLDIFSGHASGIKTIAFTNTNNLISASHSEILVWNINI